jgi:hypothetical protein
MANKIVWVHSVNWEKTVSVDSDIFDDVLGEACTRVLSENIKENNMTVSPFIEARLKNGKQIYIYNTYKILINAGYYTYAENLRTNFKSQTQIDLKNEPIRG